MTDLIKRDDELAAIDTFKRDFEQSWKVQFSADIAALPAINLADRIEELEKQCSVYARSDQFLVEEIKELEAKLTKAKELVAQAFCEGFEDGHGGGYADSNSYPAWMRSYALAELEGKE